MVPVAGSSAVSASDPPSSKPNPDDHRVTVQAFRLRPIMKQGTASSIPETWTHYSSVEDARAGAKPMYQNDRVLRVMVVTDSVGSFVEWIER